jgi:hypothetical protein
MRGELLLLVAVLGIVWGVHDVTCSQEETAITVAARFGSEKAP